MREKILELLNGADEDNEVLADKIISLRFDLPTKEEIKIFMQEKIKYGDLQSYIIGAIWMRNKIENKIKHL